MFAVNRRVFFANSAAAAVALSASAKVFSSDAERRQSVTFSFGTYGMRSLTAERAVRAIAEVGYDGVELAALADWDSAPARMPPYRRQALRGLLDATGLQLTAVLDNIQPTDDDSQHVRDLERLGRVIELGRDISPQETPLVQTVLGGGDWEEKKSMLVSRLADWGKLAERTKTVICIKPHRGGVMSKPAEAVWIIQQLDQTPWIRMVYDYSHYAFRDMTIEATVQTSLKYTAHIAVKDTIRMGDGTTFVLPGASGAFDYGKLFTLFYNGGYRGDICCEVSSAVWRKPDYDPLAAAKTCYQNIAPILKQARIPRRSRPHN